MSLLTGAFEYNTVNFAGKTFITRDVHIPNWGEKAIGDKDMEHLLMENGKFVSEEAENLENGIFYFIDGWKLRSYSDEELAKAVAKEVNKP